MAAVTVEPVGNPTDCCASDPIEDVALAPRVQWSDADMKEAMEKAIRIYDLEPGHWIELEWPPTAGLADPGYMDTTEFQPCEAHADLYFDSDNNTVCDDCSDCQASVQEVVEKMAQWSFTTTLRVNQLAFDRDGNECHDEVFSDNAFEVAVIEQDPRSIIVGPPGEGRHW